jgi:rfaE bifunctional protein nucleotidyltransferase chain/domain
MIEPPPPAPLLDGPGLDRFLTETRGAGLRLVFTNGCFDLIHPGHVAYLTQARFLGDRLIVGLNTDESVRRLKGPDRPLIGQEGRAAVLGALRCVDAVVLFEEDTPRDLILRIRPHVLVKGGDYRAEDVVGATDLPAWGGTVRILPYLPGHSTSEIISRLRNPKGNNPFSA